MTQDGPNGKQESEEHVLREIAEYLKTLDLDALRNIATAMVQAESASLGPHGEVPFDTISKKMEELKSVLSGPITDVMRRLDSFAPLPVDDGAKLAQGLIVLAVAEENSNPKPPEVIPKLNDTPLFEVKKSPLSGPQL
jgi:hypothetical protein